MSDDTKPEPFEFPLEAEVNGVSVTVALLLRPGTTVSVKPPERANSQKLL
jgi:hypothetical protein